VRRSWWLWGASLAVYAFLYIPLAIVVLFSFNDSKLNAEWVGFTWSWYETLFRDDAMLGAARNSLFIAVTASIAATVLGLGLAVAPEAWADPVSDACAALVNVRTSLYAMLSAKEETAQDALKAKVKAESAKLDSVLAGMTGANAKTAADFKAVWDQFKATRDNEIIPTIQKGNADAAKKLADGIQYERLSKMWGIMSCSRK